MNDVEGSLLDPETLECPFPFFRRLREEAPVCFRPELRAYYVTRYQDIRTVKKRPDIFSNDIFEKGGMRSAAQAAAEAYRSEHGWARVSTLQRTDPPTHTLYRQLVDKAFTPRRVRTMVPYIEGVVNDLIDDFIKLGECDFVRDFATPLPCTVIADQLGVPRSEVHKIKVWSDAMLGPGGHHMDEAEALECARLVVEAQHYFAEVIEDRKRQPRDDIISDLVHAEVDGRRLDMHELQDLLDQLLTGGNETTTNAIGSGMMLLLRHPDQMRYLRENPDGIKNFVEEVLRYETPVLHLFRVTTQDTELGGVPIPEGSMLALGYAAANRDEAVFPEGERFDVCRHKAGAHLSFGSGPHFCPGASLGRQEMLSGFRILLERLDDIRTAVPDERFEHVPHSFLRGLRSLPIRFNARC